MSEDVYVFDTSSLVGAWVRWYPPDVFPALWERIEGLGDLGRLIVPEEVYEELEEREDDLHLWMKSRREQLVAPTTRATMLESRAVLADHAGLTKTGTGRGKADPWVIALAALRGGCVVTEEKGGSAGSPRIPYVCQVRRVSCRGLLDVIRSEGWRFSS